MAASLAIEALLKDIRQRVAGAGPHDALTAVPNIQIWRIADGSDLPQGGAHFGLTVDIPSAPLSTAAGFKGKTAAEGEGGQMATSNIIVRLYARVKAGQNKFDATAEDVVSGYGITEDDAIAAMRAVRKRLTGSYNPDVGGACTSGGLRFLGQLQGPHPATKGWYRVTLSLEAKHLIEVGE